jgi:hypothetical protein
MAASINILSKKKKSCLVVFKALLVIEPEIKCNKWHIIRSNHDTRKIPICKHVDWIISKAKKSQ